ncbi:MAG: TRZ/ATZ family hydrolase [Gammaproteobacteria bacterium]|nr:MAG: TRZ/ATZ family hydrolase [Gammaproteobacteria bacterium]RLA22000.1 MAG: TRZ/ATZ family hydrolase [Gammaproteobacteria bacterium]
MKVDTLINSRWIIPVVPDNLVLENHALVINEGKIIDLLPQDKARSAYQAAHTETLEDHALIPGLINAHTHAAMSLMRGIADDLPLITWLNEHIWPLESRWVSESFVHDGSELAIAEMIRGGTTCFNDMYFFPEVTARVARKAKIRASIGMIVIDFPTVWAQNSDEYLSKGLSLHDEFKHDPLISLAFAPHAPYTVSDEPLKKLQMYADELQHPVHIHLHETQQEITDSLQQHGVRPIERLRKLQMVGPSLTAVHMTQLDEEEINLLAKSGCSVVHCPESNMKLASGFCPLAALIDSGVNVALGTDGAASNNDLDLLGEMRTAALLGKAVSKDARSIPAATALKMATLNGAKALGLEQTTGSLEVGKAADITAITLSDQLETAPVFDPVSQIVYSASRNQVTDVWVNGHQVLKSTQLTTLDKIDILEKAKIWGEKLQKPI